MAEKVLFSIVGLHTLDGEDAASADEIEVINVADYYNRDGVHYIMYEEVMEGTTSVTRNMVKIKPKKVEISKKGAVTTQMCFEEGKSNQTSYFTAEGELSMGMDTKSVVVEETAEEIVAQISYGMLMNFEHIADCKIKLKIQKKRTNE